MLYCHSNTRTLKNHGYYLTINKDTDMETVEAFKFPNRDHLTGLTEYTNILSTEGNFVTSISSFVIGKFQPFAKFFDDSKKELPAVTKNVNAHGKALLKVKKDLRGMGDLKYSAIADITTPVMVGTHLSLLDGLQELVPAMKDVQTNLIPILENCEEYVNKFIGDEEFLSSNRPATLNKDLAKKPVALDTVIRTIISKDSLVDRRSVGELIPNTSSILTVYELAMELSKMMDVKLLKSVNDRVNDLTSSVEYIYEFLSDNKVSGTTNYEKSKITALAYNLEHTAHYLSVAMSIIHISNQHIDMTTGMIKQIKKHS